MIRGFSAFPRPATVAVLGFASSVLACLGSAQPSEAKTFTYRNSSKHAEEVRGAVRAWNNTGVRVRFVKAKRGTRPDLRFADYRFTSDRALGEMAGRVIRLRKAAPRDYGDPLLRTMGHTAAHEIGHFLGLPHPERDRCSLMVVGDETVMQDLCSAAPRDTVPCGPQRRDVRAVAHRYGWKPGGRRRARAARFGRCLYKDGPSGARFIRSMCGPERIEVEQDDTVRTAVLEFDGDGDWGPEVVVSCVWKVGDGPFENFEAVVQEITPARARPGPKPSGNCNGSRADTAEWVHSRTRYLSVLAYGDYRPVGGAGTLLASVLGAAEIGEVGLACADGP